MAHHGDSPEQQRLWAEEVIYLHSLWHQNPNPNPNSRKRKNVNDRSHPSDPPVDEIEWPTNPLPSAPDPAGSWPEFSPNPASKPPHPAIDHAKLAPARLHNNAIKFSRHFLGNSSDDSDDDDDDDDDDGESEEGAYAFFLKIFETDEELRGYYEKNWEGGEFFCLVCVGLGVRVGKRYKDCVGLVQHSKSVSKKGRGPHRALGRAVCRVLGWDVSRLPSIVLDLGGSLGQSLAKAKNDLQKESGIKEVTETPNKDAVRVEPVNCMASKDLSKQPNDSDDGANGELMNCMKTKELSELLTRSRDSVNGELMSCTEAKDFPELLTNLNPNLCTVSSTSFEKESRKELKKQSQPPDSLDVESKWPDLSPEPSTEPAGWPEFNLKPSKTPLSMAEQARAAALRLQQNGLRASHDFLKKNDSSSDDDDDASGGGGDDYEEEEGEEEIGEGALKFFLGLFERDRGLRIYYEKNWGNGEFYCLVCRGIGIRNEKTYKNCVGIVQHSTSLLTIKRRGVHQGFAYAVCRVLGWDISRLPSIAFDLGESSAQSLPKPAEPQGESGEGGKE